MFFLHRYSSLIREVIVTFKAEAVKPDAEVVV